MATERVAFDRFMPNSPRKLSVPTAVLSMTIMPFMNERARSSSAPFDSRLPVVSRPMWRVYEVRSNSWSASAEHDLDLLDGAAVALQAVVDAAADEPRAELGERPVQAWRPRR